jgi:hypothetical protein
LLPLKKPDWSEELSYEQWRQFNRHSWKRNHAASTVLKRKVRNNTLFAPFPQLAASGIVVGRTKRRIAFYGT